MNKADCSERDNELLECEKFWIFLVMTAVGGFLGSYTYILKGGVFCNAQTANFVLMAAQIGSLDFRRALYYLIPISAYLAGAVISELLPKFINRRNIIRWDTFFIAFEILFLGALGFVPDAAPAQICQVAVNFIASMQYNTFRQAQRIPMATTFCTNHLRQTGVWLVKWLRHKDKDARHRLALHAAMIGAFLAGAVTSAFLCTAFKGRAIFFAEIPLVIVFAALLHADRGKERDKLSVVPHGH